MNLEEQDHLGDVETELTAIFGSYHQQWEAPLSQGLNSMIHVTGEELIFQNTTITLRLRVEELKSASMLSSPRAFLVISRMREDSTWTPCFKTEVRG